MLINVAVPSPIRRRFDYLPPEADCGHAIVRGMRVVVPFGGRSVIGIVTGLTDKTDQPSDKLKKIQEVVDNEPVIEDTLLDLFIWAADYYQHPLGDALLSTLPALLRKGQQIPHNMETHWQLSALGLGLADNALANAKKQQALLQLLRDSGPIKLKDIRSAGFGKPIIAALEEKALIEPILKTPEKPPAPLLAESPLTLRPDQKSAMESLELEGFNTFLLFGDTGSGKTEIYLQAIEQVIAKGRQALVLVPEINLTPQTLKRFHDRFNCRIVALHSGLTDKVRLRNWTSARCGDADIVIGTRSAIFTPLQNPGIIILDEEHDQSFKQQDGFRYSARDVAVMRASRESIPVVLGSATPSLESILNCQRGRYRRLDLVRQQVSSPDWQLIDLKTHQLQSGISGPLITAIQNQLNNSKQVLLFLNRRGYSPLLLCHDCGWRGECHHCSATLTAHLKQNRLICHHCEWQQPIPNRCKQCQSPNLTFVGQGTERSEETLKALFPSTPVFRIDKDSTRTKGAMATTINVINQNEPCILVGTQMLSKGHHFPSVLLAALLEIDSGLFSPDFRALERTAQMVTQVAGRAGRGKEPGTVLIQTHYADHPLLAEIIKADYRKLSQTLLEERQRHQLPPFSYLAIIRAESQVAEKAQSFLTTARHHLEQRLPPSPGVNYLGPLPSTLERRKGFHRFALSIFADNRPQLSQALTETSLYLETLKQGRQIRWSVDVDPQDSP